MESFIIPQIEPISLRELEIILNIQEPCPIDLEVRKFSLKGIRRKYNRELKIQTAKTLPIELKSGRRDEYYPMIDITISVALKHTPIVWYIELSVLLPHQKSSRYITRSIF